MKQTLPILTVVGLGMAASALAQPPASTRNSGRTSAVHPAQLLVRKAAENLQQHSAVAAKVRLAGQIYQQRFQGVGTYLQGPADKLQVRLEMKLAVGQTAVTFQQIADGHYLWTRRAIDDSQTLSRVDLAQVQGRAGQGGIPLAGAPHAPPLPGYGGLPRLLRHLESSFDFSSAQQTHLAGVPGYTVRGGWSRAALAHLLPEQKADIDAGREPNLRRLAPQVPDQVLVFLGRDDLFPYRVEYRRTEGSWQATLPLQAPASVSLLALDLFEVRLNGPIDGAPFDYAPGNDPFTDETAAFLSSRQWAAPQR